MVERAGLGYETRPSGHTIPDHPMNEVSLFWFKPKATGPLLMAKGAASVALNPWEGITDAVKRDLEVQP